MNINIMLSQSAERPQPYLRICPWANARMCIIEVEKYTASGVASVLLDYMMRELATKVKLNCQLKGGGYICVQEVMKGANHDDETQGSHIVSWVEVDTGHYWTQATLEFNVRQNCDYFLFYKVDNIPGRELYFVRNAVCESIMCDPIADLARSFHNKTHFLEVLNKCLDDDDFDPYDVHHIRTALGMSGARLREYILAVKHIMNWNYT